VRGGSHARYVPSGHLVYGAAGTLRAVAFDPATLATRGTPVPVVSDVVVKSTGGVDAAMADDGTLAYVQGAAAGGDADRTLVWVDRSGREVPLDLPAGRYFDPELSPDGSRIALAVEAAGNLDVWVIYIADGRRRRITFGPATDRYPLWTPDGKALVFMSARDGVPAIYRKGLDADLAEEKIFGDPTRTLVPWSWSADGQTLVLSELATTGSSFYDVGALTLSGKPVWKSLLGTAFLESQPVVSPDGKWMAYMSNEGGDGGVYVRPFPDVTAGVEQVSTEGGNNPVWPRDGRELLYRNGNEILSVAVELSPTFRPRTPEVLFMGTYFDEVGTQWDATRDGKRLLMLKPVASDAAEVRQNQIVVVQNWAEELKRLVPVK
jgi:serine/threonine-protein kinase